MKVEEFISSLDNKIYNRIRSSQSDAECRRYLKEHLNKLHQPTVIESLPEHECKYCGAMTTQPDEECYRAPVNSGKVL